MPRLDVNAFSKHLLEAINKTHTQDATEQMEKLLKIAWGMCIRQNKKIFEKIETHPTAIINEALASWEEF